MWAQIVCYKKSGIHWYHWHPTFLWKFNFTLVRRLISAIIWDISGLWNRSDGRNFREKRIDISRFLAPYEELWKYGVLIKQFKKSGHSEYFLKSFQPIIRETMISSAVIGHSHLLWYFLSIKDNKMLLPKNLCILFLGNF